MSRSPDISLLVLLSDCHLFCPTVRWWAFLSHCLVIIQRVSLSSSQPSCVPQSDGQPSCPTIRRSAFLSHCLMTSQHVLLSGSQPSCTTVWSYCLVVSLSVPLSVGQSSCLSVWRSSFFPRCLEVAFLSHWVVASIAIPLSGGLSFLSALIPVPLFGGQPSCPAFVSPIRRPTFLSLYFQTKSNKLSGCQLILSEFNYF